MSRLIPNFFILSFLLTTTDLIAQLSVSAGNNASVCLGNSVNLGGSPTASGGTAPYTYSWVPVTYLSNSTAANPACTPAANTSYTVYVTDAAGNTASGSVSVSIYSQSLASAGNGKTICAGDTAILGGPVNLTGGGTVYSWAPNTNISSTSVPYPKVWPPLTTTYTLTVTGPNCPPNVSTVTVTVRPLPPVSAGPNVTIYSGQSIQLQGSGAVNYLWSPSTSLNYPNIPNPDAAPTLTIIYNLLGIDQYGCAAYSSVKVTVIETDSLFFYNTYTPNGDGDNDNWYIGNVYSYPNNTLTVYNRYGRVVYNAHPYINNWHGKTGGDELPAATYYYIFDPGNGKKEIHGAVTIIR